MIAKRDYLTSLLAQCISFQPQHKYPLKVQNSEYPWLELVSLVEFLGNPRIWSHFNLLAYFQ